MLTFNEKLLKCIKCGYGELNKIDSGLKCHNCGYNYNIVNGVPVFIESKVKIMPIEHCSNQLPIEVINWIKNSGGMCLNIGAGSTDYKIPNCIEFEYSIWKNTDVVGDAHFLPFKNNSFDSVVSFNTFEHLYNPELAANEIFRVLKPKGKAIIQTAFLQPLHEEPIHFYNATKYGIMNWFKRFNIENIYVSENFNPSFTLSWIVSEILNSIQDSPKYAEISKMTLEECSEIWRNPNKRKGVLWECLLNLPQSTQEKFSAGFQIEVIKN